MHLQRQERLLSSLAARDVLLGVFVVGMLTSITLAQLALAALLVRLVYRIATGQARLAGAPLALPVGVWVGASVVAALLSARPVAGLEAATRGLWLIAAFYVVLDALDERKASRLADVLLVLTGIVSVIAIVQVAFCAEMAVLSTVPGLRRLAAGCHRAQGFYSIYMTLAGVLTLVLLATLPRVWAADTLAGRGVRAVAWAAGGMALALTQTRGAWLGFLAGVAVLLVLLRRGRLILAVGVIVLVTVALALPDVRGRAASIVDPSDPTASERWAMWGAALRIARNHPATGVGPGQVRQVYMDYVDEAFRRPNGHVHVHNTPLHILAERGVLGLVAWSALFVAFFWHAGKILRAAPPGPAAVAASSMAAIVGFLVGGLTEYNFGDSEVAMVAYTIMALPFAVAASQRLVPGASSAGTGERRPIRCALGRERDVARPHRVDAGSSPAGFGGDRPPRVALVHDWLTGMRGGERCLEVFCELFPDAPLFTLLHIPGSVSAAIERRPITTSFIQRLPGAVRRYRQYLPLFPAAVRAFDLRGYDLVLSLSHCVAKAVRRPPGALHLCYCFTPMRYIWDLYDDYTAATGPLGHLVAPAGAAALRRWDRRTHGVDHFVAISRHIARRIERAYGRAADVIYPPVDVARFQPRARPDGFYLVVSALVPYKRVELAVAATRRLGRRLVVVGTGPEAERLRGAAGPMVEFLGWRSDEEVADLYARCRAVLFTAVEDFGIVPLEAAAAGRPTIALGRGGALETIVGLGAEPPGVAATGLFFPEPTVEALVEAILRFEALQDRFDPQALRARTMQFDRSRFAAEIQQYVIGRWTAHRGAAPAL